MLNRAETGSAEGLSAARPLLVKATKKARMKRALEILAPRVGFEPTTLRLTAGCSAVELPRNFFGALRFLGARKYYRHFNCRRNPLFQNFFSAADFGGCGLIRNLIRTLRFRYRSQPDMRRSSGQGIKWKLFTESWQRTRVFRIAEGDFGCRMLPERR